MTTDKTPNATSCRRLVGTFTTYPHHRTATGPKGCALTRAPPARHIKATRPGAPAPAHHGDPARAAGRPAAGARPRALGGDNQASEGGAPAGERRGDGRRTTGRRATGSTGRWPMAPSPCAGSPTATPARPSRAARLTPAIELGQRRAKVRKPSGPARARDAPPGASACTGFPAAAPRQAEPSRPAHALAGTGTPLPHGNRGQDGRAAAGPDGARLGGGARAAQQGPGSPGRAAVPGPHAG